MEKLPQDFAEFLKLPLNHDVCFLIVGGYAVAYHGYSRYTGDIDIWVEATPTNADRLLAALNAFSMIDSKLTKELLIQEGQVIRMGVEPTRIEILTGISGVAFNQCFQNRIIHKVDDLGVPFLSLLDLRKNKKAYGWSFLNQANLSPKMSANFRHWSSEMSDDLLFSFP